MARTVGVVKQLFDLTMATLALRRWPTGPGRVDYLLVQQLLTGAINIYKTFCCVTKVLHMLPSFVCRGRCAAIHGCMGTAMVRGSRHNHLLVGELFGQHQVNTILYCTILYCIVLHCIALHCIVWLLCN